MFAQVSYVQCTRYPEMIALTKLIPLLFAGGDAASVEWEFHHQAGDCHQLLADLWTDLGP